MKMPTSTAAGVLIPEAEVKTTESASILSHAPTFSTIPEVTSSVLESATSEIPEACSSEKLREVNTVHAVQLTVILLSIN